MHSSINDMSQTNCLELFQNSGLEFLWLRPRLLAMVSCISRKHHINDKTGTAHKMEFSIMDFFSKCDLICRKLRIWSQLLKKSLLENFILCAVILYETKITADAPIKLNLADNCSKLTIETLEQGVKYVQS